MAAKFILPALALVGTVMAQCDGPSFTITTSDDASQIENCQTYNGDIIISSDAQGEIDIPGLTGIKGDFTCTNASALTAITASNLQTIGGTFDLEEIQILTSLQMPSLTGVNRIRWIALPGLQSLSFTSGVSQANQVYISNTGLTDLKGIELTAVASMDVNNNQYLKTINVNALTNVTSALSFSANGPDLDIEFPNLESAANLTFRNVTSISLPSLADVQGAMGFYSNYFQSFSAPNLTETGGTIAFVDSPSLSSLEFDSLQTIGGGLLLANNTELASVTGFNKLQTIDGDINFYGTFSAVSFNSLSDVKGASNVYTSSSNTTICDQFNTAKSKQVIKGKVTCQTSSNNIAGNGSTTGSSGSSHSNAAMRNLNYDPSAPLTGFAALVAAVLFI